MDVNVHPSKQEIRFSRQQHIYDAIVAAVSAGLVHEEKPSWAPSKIHGSDNHIRGIWLVLKKNTPTSSLLLTAAPPPWEWV